MAPRQDRRAFPRVPADVPVVASVLRSRLIGAGLRVPGTMRDVSAGGAAFTPCAPLAVGDAVLLAVRGDDRQIEAVVVRSEPREAGGIVCACRFADPQPWLVDHIACAAVGA